MTLQIETIRHPKEKKYGSIMLWVGCLIWISLIIICGFILYLGYYPAIILIALGFMISWTYSYISRAITHAYIHGNLILITPEQFPHLYNLVKETAEKIGFQELPSTFILNSSGKINAMAVRLIGKKRYIWLTSALIDTADTEQIRFVIGHELGHHMAGHLWGKKFWLSLPAHFIPILNHAYSRARELTCDRVGIWASDNLPASQRALQMLGCGSHMLNPELNPAIFLAQEKMIPKKTGFLLHIFSRYPRLTKRVESITTWYISIHSKKIDGNFS